MDFLNSHSYLITLTTNELNIFKAWEEFNLLCTDEVGRVYATMQEAVLHKFIILFKSCQEEHLQLIVKIFGASEQISAEYAKNVVVDLIMEIIENNFEGWIPEQKMNARATSYVRRNIERDISVKICDEETRQILDETYHKPIEN